MINWRLETKNLLSVQSGILHIHDQLYGLRAEVKIWHSKEQDRLFSWTVKQSDGRWLLYSPRRKNGFINIMRSSIMAQTISLVGPMSMNLIPQEQKLCPYLSKNSTPKKH